MTSDQANPPALALDGLIRAMGVNRPCRHMVFLGAGASVTSGLPSGWQCIWQWKTEIYLSSQSHLSPMLLGDPSLPHVQDRVQAWLDAQGGFPPNGSADEYAFYAERCYPDARDRRQYFENMIVRGTPGLGYRLLALLIEAGHLRWLWTTNFDDMVDRARSGDRQRIVRQFGMDSKGRIAAAKPDDPALHHAFLHGDYRYDRLRNTASELRALDTEFLDGLTAHCRNYPLVVVGYSGRDESVMTALEHAYKLPGEGGLYWIGMRGSRAIPRVEKLLLEARQSGRQSEYVECDGFDAFMLALARFLLREAPWVDRVESLIRGAAPQRHAFKLDGYRRTSDIIKSNAWPIIPPPHVYQFKADGIESWADLRDLVAHADGRICAGLAHGNVIAMGRRDDITSCFGLGVGAPIEQIPIAPQDLYREDGVVMSVVREGIVRALATGGLTVGREGRRWYLYEPDAPMQGGVDFILSRSFFSHGNASQRVARS